MIEWNKYDEKLDYNVHRYKPNIDKSDDDYIKKLIDDIQNSMIEYGLEFFQEYFYYDFEGKDTEYRSTFIGEVDYKKFVINASTGTNAKLVKNKYKAYELIGEFYGRDIITISGFEDYSKFCDFVSKHKKYIIKETEGSLGSNVSVVTVTENDNIKSLFFLALQYGSCIIEEYINQNNEMAKFNKSSVNTVRVCSFYDGNDVQFLYAMAKFGRAGQPVDNGAMGGVLTLVDEKNGEIISNAYDENLIEYETHPDSKIKFIGHQIPKWNELLEMVKKVVIKCGDIRFVGWDVALTDKGWIIVEGNSKPNVYPIQMLFAKTYGHGYRKLMEETIGRY